MICPQCKTENRDDRGDCYHCGQELATLRMIVNRARNHYNDALEHAERGRDEEAIRELNHALELDGSFVEAWLVLGTLQARAEHLDEAKAAWEKAMSLDPRFERGYQYLLKAQRIEPSLPQLRKLKTAVVGLGALLILAIAFGLFQSRPDTGMQKIAAALDAREEGRWSEALERLADAKSDPLASRKAKRAAGALSDEISERLKDNVESIRQYLRVGDFGHAVERITKVEALNPPGWAQQEIGAIKAQMTQGMADAAGAEMTRFRAGKLTYEELSDKLKNWIQLAGEENAAPLRKMLDEVAGEHHRTVLAGLRPEILAIPDDAKAAQRIDELSVQYPELKPDLEEMLRSRLAVVAEKKANEFDRLVQEGKLDEARERLTAFRALYEGLGRSAPADVLTRMETAIGKTQKSIELKSLEEAFANGRYEQALALAAEAQKLDLSPEENGDVQARKEDAERLLADELWKWSESLDQQWETVSISLDEARRLIQHYSLIIDHAPTAEATYRATHTLFRAAAAELKLGHAKESKSLLDRLKSEYADSAVLGYPAFAQFEKRLDAALQRG